MFSEFSLKFTITIKNKKILLPTREYLFLIIAVFGRQVSGFFLLYMGHIQKMSMKPSSFMHTPDRT